LLKIEIKLPDSVMKVTSRKIQEEQKQSVRPVIPANSQSKSLPKEYGGPKGKEPTRYGDWEKNGRCTDF
jgi:hypothetical protein